MLLGPFTMSKGTGRDVGAKGNKKRHKTLHGVRQRVNWGHDYQGDVVHNSHKYIYNNKFGL